MVKYIIIMMHMASIKMSRLVELNRALLGSGGFIHIPPPNFYNYRIILLMHLRRINRLLPIPCLPIPCFTMIMFLVERLFMGQDEFTRRILPVLQQHVFLQLAYSNHSVVNLIQFVRASHLRSIPQYMLDYIQHQSRHGQKFLRSPSNNQQVLDAYMLAVQNMFDSTISLQSIDRINEALSQHIQGKNILSEIELFAAFMAIIRCIYSDLWNGRKRLSYCYEDMTFSFPEDAEIFCNPLEIDPRELNDLGCLMLVVKNMVIHSPFFEKIRKEMYDRLFYIFENHEDVKILLLICLKAGIWIGYDPHDLHLLCEILNCTNDVGFNFDQSSCFDDICPNYDTQNPFNEKAYPSKNTPLSEQLSVQANEILDKLRQQF
jgi:hypothetical protein